MQREDTLHTDTSLSLPKTRVLTILNVHKLSVSTSVILSRATHVQNKIKKREVETDR